MSGVEAGVDRIVDQIVNPKLNTTFMPEVENVIYKYFGTSKPEEGEDMVNGNNFDDENSQNLPNGDSYDDVGGKISTRNLSTISSDAEMLNFDANYYNLFYLNGEKIKFKKKYTFLKLAFFIIVN